jgi:hypothetical protein
MRERCGGSRSSRRRHSSSTGTRRTTGGCIPGGSSCSRSRSWSSVRRAATGGSRVGCSHGSPRVLRWLRVPNTRDRPARQDRRERDASDLPAGPCRGSGGRMLCSRSCASTHRVPMSASNLRAPGSAPGRDHPTVVASHPSCPQQPLSSRTTNLACWWMAPTGPEQYRYSLRSMPE